MYDKHIPTGVGKESESYGQVISFSRDRQFFVPTQAHQNKILRGVAAAVLFSKKVGQGREVCFLWFGAHFRSLIQTR